MTINVPLTAPPHGSPALEAFTAAAKNNDAVYLSVSGQSLQVLGTGTSSSGRSVAWVDPDLDTARTFTNVLGQQYGIGITKAIAQELNLTPSPGRPLSSRTITQALDMAQTAHQALAGVDFLTALQCSAQGSGPIFRAACQTLEINPASLSAPQRQQIDQAMRHHFEQAALSGQTPVRPDIAADWLRDLLHA